MTDQTISAMTAGSALGGTEVFEMVQAAATRKATARQIADYVTGAILLASSGAALTFTGSTSEHVFATIPILANTMGLNGLIEVDALFTCTNNANAKTQYMRLGGAALVNTNLASRLVQRQVGRIQNRNSAASQIGLGAHSAQVGQSNAAWATSTIDTTTNQDLTIAIQLATSTDTVTLEAYAVRLWPHA